jgi:hypothetical protein
MELINPNYLIPQTLSSVIGMEICHLTNLITTSAQKTQTLVNYYATLRSVWVG